MIRLLGIVAVTVILISGVPRSSAQSRSTASSPQVSLEEAVQLNQVAGRLYREGKYREAVAPAERALALREKALGPNHPDVAESLNNLAALYRAQGAYAKAEPLYARALEIREKALGPHHPDVAESLNNLAALYRAQGAYAQAEPLLTRALDIAEKVLGPNDPDGLDQAGLAMADANRGPGSIVTAREIAGFDWTGTQLVVLSACQTGVGALASGDGVYGLRRALVIAGAASQVVSLWSVADASTPALMRDYYAALQRGTGRAEALRQAKRHLLQQPGYAHPFYWAAFIPAGDWRPLDATAFLLQKSAP